MKVLILGGTGMLGHKLWASLSEHHQVMVTVRGAAKALSEHPAFDGEAVIEGVDALNFDSIIRAVGEAQPDAVINCIGLIKQHQDAQDPLLALTINAAFPHRLVELTRAAGVRLIHISTDCVFSGDRGNYKEEDVADARDLYGRSKYLGEVDASHAVTLRTSIVGPELSSHYGLLEWFLSQQGAVEGYTRAVFNGFTTDELARIINDYVLLHPDLRGLYHVSSDPINKYDLLHLFNTAYDRHLSISENTTFQCDRSLISDRFRQAVGYSPPAWPDMVQAMATKHVQRSVESKV